MTPTERPPRQGRQRLLITAWVMLAALLAFGLEPLTGRMVLPKYGGSAHVWNVTMMVFQGLLLLGYAYAHGIGRRIGRLHIAVLLLPLLFLPITFGGPSAPDSPVLTLSGRLLWHVGVPFLVLSTTAVMAQTWWARSSLAAAGEPYGLYAASNVGSLLALLAYPLLIEPALGLHTQRWVWSAAYLVFVALGAAAWSQMRPGAGPEPLRGTDTELMSPAGRAPRRRPEADHEADQDADNIVHARSDARNGGYWFVLSAIPSLLLLAVTNKVAFEVGSFPLVWVVPLALYLSSFVVAFRAQSAWNGLGNYWPEIVLLLAITTPLLHHPVFLFAFGLLFFLLCVAVHRELYLRRPDPARLTTFYLVIAAGGWTGGILVALVAPVVFDRFWELPLGLLAVVVALAAATSDRLRLWVRDRSRGVVLGRGALLLLLAILCATVVQAVRSISVLGRARSFYGGYEIRRAAVDGEPYRTLVNGGTVHGLQWESDELRSLATIYYNEGGPIDEALGVRPPGARIGVVGLGAGVSAADLEAGDQLVYYEIDPVNEGLARQWFSFLDDSRGDVSVRVGDARLLLEAEATSGATGEHDPGGSQVEDTRQTEDYDVLLIDAFSGDGVPVHLLTEEALATYRSRLKEGGLIVFHISNRYNDLRGVLKANATRAGLAGAWKTGRTQTPRPLDTVARVVVLAEDPATIAPLVPLGWRPFGPDDGVPAHRAWTDDYINILQPIAAKFFGDAE